MKFARWIDAHKYYLTSLIAIAVVGLVVYAPSLRIGFWTDDYWLVDNVGRHDFFSYLKFYFDPWTQWRFYRPLQGIFWWIAYTLFASDSTGYHWMQLGLHLLNGVLVFDLVQHLTWRWRVAFLSALVYLTLPTASLAILWVGVADPLVAFFYLLTVRIWIDFCERGNPVSYALSLAAFACALLSKEIAAVLPIALFLADVWFAGKSFDLFRTIKRYAPFALLLLAYLLIEMNIARRGVFTTYLGYGIGGHMLTALLHHLSTLVFPWAGESLAVYLWLAIVLVLGAFAFFKKEWRLLFVPTAAALAVLPILPFPTGMALAPRYLYVPLIGTAIAIAWFIDGLYARTAAWRWMSVLISIGAVVFLFSQSASIAEDAQNFEGTVRQERLQFKQILQAHSAFAPDTYLYFIHPPMDASYLSGLFFLRYGTNVVVSGSDYGFVAGLRDHNFSIVLYQDDEKNWREVPVDRAQSMNESPTLPVKFGESFSLDRVELPAYRLRRSEDIVVILNVRPLSVIDKDYSVFAHLVDQAGRTVAGTDQLLLKEESPTSRWRANESVSQGVIVPIDSAIAPGDYELQIGVYYLPTLERLPVGVSTDQVVIVPLTIQ